MRLRSFGMRGSTLPAGSAIASRPANFSEMSSCIKKGNSRSAIIALQSTRESFLGLESMDVDQSRIFDQVGPVDSKDFNAAR
jgi:hypothetical protein